MKKIMMTASALLFSLALTTGAVAAGGGYGTGATGQQNGQTQQQPGAGVGTQQQQQQQLNVMSADDLIGQSVVGLQDEDLGSISDVLIDVENGQVAFAIVSANGVLGVGAEQYIVPWAALEISPEAEEVRLAISQDRLEQAPTGETVADRQEAEQIHQFYGVAPYWEEDRQMMDQEREPMFDMERDDDTMRDDTMRDDPMMR
jgi:sporulation protein YlmC with PRC-barrel domain